MNGCHNQTITLTQIPGTMAHCLGPKLIEVNRQIRGKGFAEALRRSSNPLARVSWPPWLRIDTAPNDGTAVAQYEVSGISTSSNTKPHKILLLVVVLGMEWRFVVDTSIGIGVV